MQPADIARAVAVLTMLCDLLWEGLGWCGWWPRLHWSSSWDITTWFHHNRSFWSCLRTTENHLQKFQVNFLQPFSFLGHYMGKSWLRDLQEERQWKRLKAMKQRHQGTENPPLNCRNGKGILHSPLLCFCTGSVVISARDISVLEKQAVVARDTMIASEGSQLPSPVQCHSYCRAWGASAHACKITLFNFLFL